MNEAVWIIGILALLGVLVFTLSGSSNDPGGESIDEKFVPDSENDKKILVNGCSEPELNKILKQFESMYREAGEFVFEIQPEPAAPELTAVVFPGDIDPVLFAFLINYIHYPNDFDLEGRAICALGTYSLTPSQARYGTGTVAVYVPEPDEEYDQVYAHVLLGKTYVHSFTNNRWVEVSNQSMPAFVRDRLFGPCDHRKTS